MAWGRRCSLVAVGLAITFVVSVAAATARPSPKAAFSERVRAIGTQAQRALLAMPTATAPSPSEAAAMAGQLQSIYQRVAQRLAALTPPKAIKADFAIMIGLYRVSATNAAAWQSALLHGTAKQAADASAKLYTGLQNYRASQAIVRMSREGYYFGTFFR